LIAFGGIFKRGVAYGLKISFENLIPTIFPFMIISDLCSSYLRFNPGSRPSRIFEKTFCIPPSAIVAFLLGTLCGFPLGVKCASELYSDGRITRDECERLIGFCNNTGPAFLVCGIGLGLRGNIHDGIALYLATVFSAVLTGVLFSIQKNASHLELQKYERPHFSITRSVKNAGIGSLYICSYITFFSCIAGIIKALFGEGPVFLMTVPFLEVGCATEILSKTELLSDAVSLSASAFAVGFSGFSVHLQALSFISESDVKADRYFAMKLIQGIIAAASVFLTYNLYR
jgi:sporulation integral membrane protein YlbJ